MPHNESVQSRTQLATTGSTNANLGNTLFVTTNTYFSERLRGYSSITELRDDDAIPTTSNAYAALRLAFNQPGATVPIYLGRREADDITYTPDPVVDNDTYGFQIEVIDDATQTPVVDAVFINSGVAATADSIATALFTEINTTLPVANVTAVDNTGSVTISADAGYTMNITQVQGLTEAYTTTETAAELLAAISEEDEENWYYFACEDHTETFVLAMAVEIEATESSNYPKLYSTSSQEADTITPLASPATDTMGMLLEGEYNRTFSNWHHEADTLFPEIAPTVYNGQFQPTGRTTWKFMTNIAGVSAAADLVTGKPLSTSKQGYIADRNGNWQGFERRVNFAHGGKVASGEWIDIINAKDWINDEIETRLLNLLLNNPGGKVSFDNISGKDRVKVVIDGVLNDAVNFNILLGYEPTSIPENTPPGDLSSRTLRDVNWVGYLAGAVHFIIVDGILTYRDEPLA